MRMKEGGQSREVSWAASQASGKAFLGPAAFFPLEPLPCDSTSNFQGRSPPAREPQDTQSGVSMLCHVWKKLECQVFGFYYDFRTSLAHL